MIKVAVCDDEENTRAYLSALIKAQPYPCEIAEYASAGECLAGSREMDLLFLDIALDAHGGQPDGMALARKLREQSPSGRPAIIFVSGYERYVFDAFDVGAFQYLLKPVDEERFARVFARAAGEIEAARWRPAAIRALAVQAAGVSRMVPLEDIRYIESRNHKVALYLRDGELACYAKIRDLEEKLGGGFCRIHKGYLVNLACVMGYSRAELALAGGAKLPISKYRYADFVKAYLRFLKEGPAL